MAFHFILVALSVVSLLLYSSSCETLKPTPRWANSCIILAGALVCFGGEQPPGTILSNAIYSLNLYHDWNTLQPLWEQIQTPLPITPRAYFSSGACWNQGFVVNGGKIAPDSAEDSIDSSTKESYSIATHFYDVKKNAWFAPSIRGASTLPPRKQHTATSDYQGRIWMWGGVSDSSTYQGTTTAYYSLWTILDTNIWSYSIPPVRNISPPPRIDHTATLITNQEILIMGGMIFTKNVTDPLGGQTLLPVSMNQIIIYNTETGLWRNHTAGGNIPAPRRGHSAVLHRDYGGIVVFGGGTPDDNQMTLNDVFVLQLDNLEWNSPSISGTPPEPRKYHQANLMDNLMLVTFGMETEEIAYNDVHILDTGNWEWISTYSPNAAWLSGNLTSTSGVIRNSTGNYGNPYTGLPKDSNGHPYTWEDPNYKPDDAQGGPSPPSESRIKAGVVAGVISGALVVLGGAIFLVLSKVVQRRRQQQQQKDGSPMDCSLPMEKYNGTIISLADLGNSWTAKPDNRSSYAHAYDDGEQHKPNEHDQV
ncbi:hypothetical protein [Absidia glauca]|uniref:Galactose oxidase n=1 Tax=Absidia glauca TaxID=4829 RepID=A0A168MR97_ABSGL|nr:hypothetical protein [Absidia glauca]